MMSCWTLTRILFIIIIYYLLWRINLGSGGRKLVGVGVRKDQAVKLDEIQASHTLGGRSCHGVQGSGKWRGCRWYPVVRYRACSQIHNETSISRRQVATTDVPCAFLFFCKMTLINRHAGKKIWKLWRFQKIWRTVQFSPWELSGRHECVVNTKLPSSTNMLL